MKNFLIIPLLVLVALLLPINGCTNPAPENAAGRDPDENQDTSYEVGILARDFAVKLGYESDLLQIGEKRILTEISSFLWEVMLDYTNGPLALVYINELTMAVETFRFFIPPDENAPPAVRPGEDIADRIAETLGLADSGYVPVPENSGQVGFYKFRKYETSGEWEIATGEVQLMVDPASHSIAAIDWREFDLPDEVDIVTTESEVIGKAQIVLQIENPVQVSTDLVYYVNRYSPQEEPDLVWEVVIDGNPVYIGIKYGEIVD